MANSIALPHRGSASTLVISLILLSLGTAHSPPLARTMPEACVPERATVRWAVIGDYGNNSVYEREVAVLVKSLKPDFIITTGDNSYPDASKKARLDENVGKYFWEYIYPYTGKYKTKIGGPIVTLNQNRFWPSPGNHDWYKSNKLKVYREFFALPSNERYYTFSAGPADFFAVSSDSNEPDGVTAGSKQAEWLKAQLLASTAAWQVVYFHHPPYTSGARHGPELNMRWPFKAWGADVVLSGHVHTYERLEIDGLPYTVNGTGGAELYEFGAPIAESLVRYNASHGVQLMEASATGLRSTFFATTGRVVDAFTVGCAPGPWIGLTEQVFMPVVQR